MAHKRVLFIGTHDDLNYIYENECHDSSAETYAEQAFGYDYLDERYGAKELNYKDFFLRSSDIFAYLIQLAEEREKDGFIHHSNYRFDVIDIRDRDNWRNVTFDYDKKVDKSYEEIKQYLLDLPSDTKLFLCDAKL